MSFFRKRRRDPSPRAMEGWTQITLYPSRRKVLAIPKTAPAQLATAGRTTHQETSDEHHE